MNRGKNYNRGRKGKPNNFSKPNTDWQNCRDPWLGEDEAEDNNWALSSQPSQSCSSPPPVFQHQGYTGPQQYTRNQQAEDNTSNNWALSSQPSQFCPPPPPVFQHQGYTGPQRYQRNQHTQHNRGHSNFRHGTQWNPRPNFTPRFQNAYNSCGNQQFGSTRQQFAVQFQDYNKSGRPPRNCGFTGQDNNYHSNENLHAGYADVIDKSQYDFQKSYEKWTDETDQANFNQMCNLPRTQETGNYCNSEPNFKYSDYRHQEGRSSYASKETQSNYYVNQMQGKRVGNNMQHTKRNQSYQSNKTLNVARVGFTETTRVDERNLEFHNVHQNPPSEVVQTNFDQMVPKNPYHRNQGSGDYFDTESSSGNFDDQDNKFLQMKNLKAGLKNIMQNLDPSEIMSDYLREVNSKQEHCFVRQAKNQHKLCNQIESASSNKAKDVLEIHLGILKKQRKTFEEYISKYRSDLTDLGDTKQAKLIDRCDEIISKVNEECRMFKRSLPIYAYKGEILSSVEQNPVTIVVVDECYSATETIPFFVCDDVKIKKVICCEPNGRIAYQLYKSCEIYSRSEIVGYDITEKDQHNENAEILITTEKRLFASSLRDPMFSSYHCAVLHCNLKRSIDADFLFEAIRSSLSVRKDFRLVIVLSRVQSMSKFAGYYSDLFSVGSIVTPPLILPIETVWKKSLFSIQEYAQEVVRTAVSIHALKGDGDVLIFLPTFMDVKNVLINLNAKLKELMFSNGRCVALYPDQIHELELVPQNAKQCRNFLIGTDWAECLHFPSVAFVIDSGIKMNAKYDFNTCSEIVKPSMISKMRAKARKYCAGQHKTGVCYRLYSKRDYIKDMSHDELPEVLCCNPFDTLVSLFTYRPDNAASTEFIEPLTPKVKADALTVLARANAIKNGQLTPLGQCIVKLPYLPKYSKLIVVGVQWGFGFDVIVLVAFLLIKRVIFIQYDDKELQQKSDAMKMHFLCHDSDTLTYLYIYRSWMENDFEKSWCTERCLDYSVMCRVREKANEICEEVRKKLKEEIITEMQVNQDSALTSLQEILFDCFKDNLCMYTGHYRSGYRLLSSQCIAFIHPSSCLLRKQNLPRFVVFDGLRSTSRNFMMSLTSVPENIIVSAVKNATVPFNLSDLHEVTLQPVVIEHVGIMLIKKLMTDKKGVKLLEIEEQIRKETKSNLVVVEPSAELGCITVFALPECNERAATIVKEMLEKDMKSLLCEEEMLVLELKKGQNTVPIMITWMKGGTAIGIKYDTKGNTPAQKSTVAETCERMSITCSFNLTWPRRFCTGFAYVYFIKKNFEFARRLALRTVIIGGVEADIELCKNEEHALYISKLPPLTMAEDIEAALEAMLPNKVVVDKVILMYQPPFETIENELEQLREQLQSSCEEFLGKDTFSIVVEMPKDTAILMKAYVNMKTTFDLTDHLELLRSNLQIDISNLIDKVPVKVEPIYHSVLYCSIDVFNALAKRFDKEIRLLYTNISSDSAGSNKEKFKIDVSDHAFNTAKLKLKTKSLDVMNVLLKKVNGLLEGEIIKCSDNRALHKLFTHGGHLWLRALEKNENIYIMEEYKSEILRLYGPRTNCIKAIDRIKEFLHDIENEVVKKLDLSRGKNLRSLLKTVIKKYGVGLKSFIEDFNLRSAEMTIKEAQMILHGSADSIEKAMAELENLAASCSSELEEEFAATQELCCTCGVPPLQLAIRLEHCGHLYCADCINGLIKNAKFPITCCADNCDKEMILEDIRKGLDYDDEQISDLLDLSMKDFITKNSQTIVYCPAPDCSMFIDKLITPIDKKWHCPLCENDICFRCNVVYHHGYSCDIYQGTQNDPDYQYKIWLTEKNANCKRCPKCKTAIEKNEGCNHMTCLTCHAHFCWKCLRAFANADQVYVHLGSCYA